MNKRSTGDNSDRYVDNGRRFAAELALDSTPQVDSSIQYGYCSKCGKYLPESRMIWRDGEVATGRSGGTVSVWASPTQKNGNPSIGFNTGRIYYKKIRVQVCHACAQKEEAVVGNIMAAVAVGILFLLFLAKCS